MSYHCLKRYKDGGICQALTGKIFWSFVYVDDAEYCVVYRGEPGSILHEVLHVFGAADLYYPPQVAQAAGRILGESVMMNSDCQVLDDLTKYLIGWHRQPTAKARQLLMATAGITEQMVSDALQAENQVRNGYGRKTYSNGTVYEGEFQEGVADGRGTFYYTNGSVYQGDVKNGSFEGRGTLRYAGGTVYEGTFQNHQFHGRGRICYADGSVYEGTFRNGLQQGRGRYSYVSGTVYEGEFRNGEPCGCGIYLFSNGDRYEGEVQNGKLHGRGCLTYADGTVRRGRFVNDEYKGNW